MKKLLCMLLCCLLPLTALCEEASLAVRWGETVATHDAPTLWWQIRQVTVGKAECYLTQIRMADPGRQIGKVTAPWETDTATTYELADKAPQASLIINASGYVTRVFSWIPENYPGVSEDYYFTPLGSLTVTDGALYRCLRDVPYYGLTLQADGLHLHVGDDPLDVLAADPTQTWSFYVECPVIRDHQSILDPDWRFTNTRAPRTIIMKMDDGSYAILTVTYAGRGLTMAECVAFMQAEIDPAWAYNLDGGPSSALMYRTEAGELVTVHAPGQHNIDIMTFGE